MDIRLTRTSIGRDVMTTSVDTLEELMLLLGQFKEDTSYFIIKIDEYPIEIEIYDDYRE